MNDKWIPFLLIGLFVLIVIGASLNASNTVPAPTEDAAAQPTLPKESPSVSSAPVSAEESACQAIADSQLRHGFSESYALTQATKEKMTIATGNLASYDGRTSTCFFVTRTKRALTQATPSDPDSEGVILFYSAKIDSSGTIETPAPLYECSMNHYTYPKDVLEPKNCNQALLPQMIRLLGTNPDVVVSRLDAATHVYCQSASCEASKFIQNMGL